MLIVAGPVGASTHDGHGHPERPERVGAVLDGIDDLHLGTDLVRLDPAPATREQLARVHSPEYLDELEAFSRRGGGSLDPDTFVTADSFDTARLAAGAALAVVEELRRRRSGVGFSVARPPGHHAEGPRGMGFCLFNNVAVAAAALTAAGDKVVIVDWDVHHGNGTQAIFWDDPAVLYVSTHQWPLYPGSGRPTDIGGPDALGTTLNIPVPAGATGDVLRLALNEVVAPEVERFAPDWVLVSCGFDAHRADPLAELALSGADFAEMAAVVSSFAPAPGRLALFLEGGYDLGALRRSTAAVLGALVGGPTGVEDPTFGGPGTDAVRAAGAARRRALDAWDDCSHGGAMDAPTTGPRGAPTELRGGW